MLQYNKKGAKEGKRMEREGKDVAARLEVEIEVVVEVMVEVEIDFWVN